MKLVAVGAPEDRPLLPRLAGNGAPFFLPSLAGTNGFSGRPVAVSLYRRLQSTPRQATSELLEEFCNVVGEEAIAGMRVTGSGGRTVARDLDTGYENEFRALARSVRALYPKVRTVFEMGGETSKYIRLGQTNGREVGFDHLGILDYQSGTECAAGTGSFIDQQASRLLYDVEDVGAAACGASCAARVAGRFPTCHLPGSKVKW